MLKIENIVNKSIKIEINKIRNKHKEDRAGP